MVLFLLLLFAPLPREGISKWLFIMCWKLWGGYIWGEIEKHFGPSEKASPKDFLPKEEMVCRKAPFSFYLNILNISQRNIHCTLMLKRYKFITSYKNYHLKVILLILQSPLPIAK